MSEEWRRDWHPEIMLPKSSDATVLVVGAGPAGLEATRALGQRGYRVLLAEAGDEPGGRVTREAALPGLGEWARVRNYRVQQIQAMPNVEFYPGNRMNADDVLAMEAEHVAIATGAHWLADGRGLQHPTPIAQLGPRAQVFTPDDIMNGRLPTGPTLIYDDDHYYMANVIAELLRAHNLPVTLVTPSSTLSSWGGKTSEQGQIIRRMMDLDVPVICARALASYDGNIATLDCIHGGDPQELAAEALVTVTLREPDDSLYRELQQRLDNALDYQPASLRRIGDCDAPAIIAAAVYSGHRYARELETEVDTDNPARYDRVFFDDD